MQCDVSRLSGWISEMFSYNILYFSELYSRARGVYCTVLWASLWSIVTTLLYCTVLYCTVLYCTVLYFIELYCTVLYCTVLYFIVLYCSVLYCTLICQCKMCHVRLIFSCTEIHRFGG